MAGSGLEHVRRVQAADLAGLRHRPLRRVRHALRHQGGQLHRVHQEGPARPDEGEEQVKKVTYETSYFKGCNIHVTL